MRKLGFASLESKWDKAGMVLAKMRSRQDGRSTIRNNCPTRLSKARTRKNIKLTIVP